MKAALRTQTSLDGILHWERGDDVIMPCASDDGGTNHLHIHLHRGVYHRGGVPELELGAIRPFLIPGFIPGMERSNSWLTETHDNVFRIPRGERSTNETNETLHYPIYKTIHIVARSRQQPLTRHCTTVTKCSPVHVSPSPSLST